jgi:hypothetical protein
MKTKLKRSKIAALLSLASLGIIGISKASSFSFLEYTNDMIKGIVEKFIDVSKDRPEDRVYLHFDKTFYKPGETIWFKAYVRNGNNLKASAQSDILHLELINPKGSVEKEISLITKNGAANGDFLIDESMAGGLYKVKAYTNWQKNEETFFEKELQVQAVVLPRLKMKLDFERKAYGASDEVVASLNLQTMENKNLSNYVYSFSASLAGNKILDNKGITNEEGIAKVKFKLPADLKTNDGLLNIMIDFEGTTESISRSIPIVLNNINLSFFPEGGDLVANLSNRLAFKALNEFGKPADVEGIIFDSNNKEVAKFKTFHQGMGSVDFRPERGEHYTAKITKPEKIKEVYALPEALEKGYTLHTEKQNGEVLPVNISSTETEELSVVAQVRGDIVYSKSFNANPGQNQIYIPVTNFPIGVAQITLFDSKGIARAERLSFVNKDKQLKISIETEKEKYLPREKVTMTIKVADERGLPMPANLSLSVVDDKLLSFADDKQGNILSSLLLQYDLKEKIEEPAFYFNTKESKSEEALDNLLLTSGWRRFTWQEVIDNSLNTPSHAAEKAIVSGVIMDAYKASALSGATVSVPNTTIKTITDKEGRFTLKNLDLSELVTLEIKASGYNSQNTVIAEYNDNMQVYLYDTKSYGEMEYERAMPMGGAGRGINNVPQMAMNNNDGMMEKKMAPMKMKEGKGLMVKDKPADKGPVINKNKQAKKEEAEKIVAVKPIIDNKKIMLMDVRKRDIAWQEDEFMMDQLEANIQPTEPKYYRARVFASPDYSNDAQPEVRTDFRSTIYWNGNVQTDRTGKTVISFYNSDEITSFRAVAEGVASDGSIGRVEKTYFTQLPFSMQVKVPVEITTSDVVSVPLILKNNTAGLLTGKLTLGIPAGMQLMAALPANISIAANQSKTIYLDFKTGTVIGLDTMEFAFEGMGLSDAFAQEIKISPKGFPVMVSLAGREKEKEYEFEIKNLVEGSVKAEFTAYPSVVTDLMKGVESILREPYGCFEQTSTSNYPNIMVKQYMMETGEAEAPERIETLLDKGYKRLITYETKEKGYEWFGGYPAHEGLTAYGLMQFSDMKRVYNNVDGEMVNRTSAWLLGRRDGNGGFKRSAQALDEFGRASEDITNAYIVYGLSEAGSREIRKELDKVYAKAMESKDPYQLALAANSLYNFKDEKNAAKVMEVLYRLQAKNGSWTGLSHSITYSQGNSLTTETTSLTILAMIKSGKPDPLALTNAVGFLIGSRSGSGGFSSTQGTVLALKALTEYAKYSKKTDESGSIEIYVDNKKVAEKDYAAGEREAIVISGLEKYFSKGKHIVKIRYKNAENPLPYSMSVNWSTSLPTNDEECKVSINTKLGSRSVFVGETVRLTTVLKNTTKDGLPMTMAIVGIPAGLSAQPWQLKELTEKKKVDFYEVRDNNIFFYYRQMLPEETREINLDLKADIAGEYEAQASSGYLYYTNEFKVWSAPERITIKRK